MEPVSVFIDTSAFFALLDADDENHGASASAWRAMMASEEHLVTTNYVLVETFALLQSRLGLRAVREFRKMSFPFFMLSSLLRKHTDWGLLLYFRPREEASALSIASASK
jgi:predicted nucleic acid-binding protein